MSLVAMGIPGLSQMNNAGMLLQAPADLATGIPAAGKWLGEFLNKKAGSETVKNIIGEDAAQAVGGAGRSMTGAAESVL